MKRTILILAMALFSLCCASAQNLGKLEVSENGHFLQYADGSPFFYLGDTAWELFHRLNREQADTYLHDRAEKGYNVIQAVALAELDGVDVDNAYGHKPLVNRNPAKPATVEGEQNDYWDPFFRDTPIFKLISKINLFKPLKELPVEVLGAATVADAYEIKNIVREGNNQKRFKLVNSGKTIIQTSGNCAAHTFHSDQLTLFLFQ